MANNVIFNVIANTSKYSKGIKTVVSETEKATKIMKKAFLGLTTTITTSLIAFAGYETELKKVGKTADLQGKELEDMGKKIIKMSETIPISTKKLLELTSASAQIGVKGKKNLIEFTETVAKLTTATNIAGVQGASSIARFLKVVDGGTKKINLFANVITNLGNNTAATEAEILNMATRVGQATTQFGLGITNTLGLSAALKDLGFRSEEAGTATGKVFRALQKATTQGGKALETLSKITKKTGKEFKEIFEKDATEALEIFIESLSNLPAEQVAQALENLELKGDRVNKLLVVLANNNDILANSMGLAREEAERQDALNKEFGRTLETLTNNFKFLKNEIINFAISVGKDLAPETKKILKTLTSIIRELREFNEITDGSISKNILFAFKLLIAIKALNKFENILKKTKIGTDLLNSSIKNLNLSLSSVLFLIIGAVKAGQKLGELIGKLGELKTSEKLLGKERKKLIKLSNKRFKIEEKLRNLSGERKIKLEKELNLVDGQIDKKKALIDLLKKEIEVRAGLKEEKNKEKIEEEEMLEEEEEIDLEDTPEKKKLLSDKELRVNLANEEVERKNQERQKFIKDEKKFGKTYANLQKLYNNERVEGARNAASELVALQNSENKALATIGKAAAIFQITNDMARGAMSAYASLAGIPIVGPGLGISAAGAVLAYGAERISNIKGNSFEVGTDFVPQDMLANIHKDEGIIPAKQNRFLESGKTALMSADLLQNLTTGNNQEQPQSSIIVEVNFDGANINGNFDEEISLKLANNIARAIDENRFSGFPTNQT